MKKARVSSKQLTLILTAVSCVGVAVTGALSALRAIKFKEIRDSYSDDDKNANKKAAVKTFWPAVLSGLATMGTIILAEGLNLKTIGGLSAAAGYLAANRKKILNKVEELGGKDLVDKVKSEVIGEEITKERGTVNGICVEETGNGDVLCCESYFGRYFRSSMEAVQKAVNMFRSDFEDGNSMSYNNLYENLGISHTGIGWEYGYPNNTYYADYIPEFDVERLDTNSTRNNCGEPVIMIDPVNTPIEGWYEI